MGGRAHLSRYAVLMDAQAQQITLSYGGRIKHERRQVNESLGRSHQRSNGFIGPQGVFLDNASGWYPWIADSLQRFSLSVDLPKGWLAVSQGEGPNMRAKAQRVSLSWREQHPQDDIYLIAAPFQFYQRQAGDITAQVYLREKDPALAERYLDATQDYLALYQELLGEYPYSKFAMVENFWDTGYGMPSFTLLGSRVIRLPFILHTSYPHEILHNWWGNGVYVDYADGNWSEGLTTYLADHLLKERQGKGAFYRRDALQKFADHVRDGDDFPLREFTGRHNSASQSVGYGKGFMLFHMLRRELGDQVFVDGLRRFYRDNRFKSASYEDLRRAFESESNRDLKDFFKQWLDRTGAPMLSVKDVQSRPEGDAYRLTGALLQTQGGKPFNLQAPVSIRLQGGAEINTGISLDSAEKPFEIMLPAQPLRLDIDPRFDLFRQLYPAEAPATFSALFGAQEGLIVLPASAGKAMKARYKQLAKDWTRGYAGWDVRFDNSLDELPSDRPIWLLGWENRFLHTLGSALEEVGVSLTRTEAKIDEQTFKPTQQSLALVGKMADSNTPLAWLGAQQPAAVPGLARKLPHYGKYSLLAFAGDKPTNTLKQQWPAGRSPLSVTLLQDVSIPPLQTMPALTETLDRRQR
jgi:hypothetical protein